MKSLLQRLKQLWHDLFEVHDWHPHPTPAYPVRTVRCSTCMAKAVIAGGIIKRVNA